MLAENPIHRQASARWRLLIVTMSCFYLGTAGGADTVTGHFELIDHHGQPVTEESYDGQLRLVFFGFSRCPVICPTTMIEMTPSGNAMSLAEIGGRAQTTV